MYQKLTVLIIDSDKTTCDFIKKMLTQEKYKVIVTNTGKDGFMQITSTLPDLVLLDLELPDMDGIEIIKKTRAWSSIPIMVISSIEEEDQKVKALDLGADDYITKPFGINELLARIRTEIRHSNKIKVDNVLANQNRQYQIKNLCIDFEKRRVTLSGKEIHLTRVEYKIVSILAKNSGRVVTYDTLINEIWGPYADDNNRILRVNMANIRRKIEKTPANPEYIFTELGVGYRMLDDESNK